MPILYKKNKAKTKKLSRKDQSLARLEAFRQEVTTDSHMIPLTELCLRFQTDPVTGLTSEKAKEILEKTGPNKLTPSRKTPEIIKFLRTLFHGFSLLLWIGAFLCYIGTLVIYFSGGELDQEKLVLGTVLIAVVVLTGTFMYSQERKSSKIMESFLNMVPPQAVVIRNGEPMTILSSEVVIGDLISVKYGDRIPADIRIIFSQNFKVDNSAITGESEPQFKSKEFTNENILETKNVAFFSTSALEGSATGIAIACGDNTVMGHVAGLTARLKPNKTPLACELERFMKLVSAWAISLGIFFGVFSLMAGHTLLDASLFLIGIIVANVPEGLLATVTVCLTVTSKRMAKLNCLVKNLEAVETLGSTSVICSDKTGTLTQNHMTVRHVWFNGRCEQAHTDEFSTENYIKDADYKCLIRCATLCSRADFWSGQENIPVLQRNVIGDASEAAILKYVEIHQVHGPTTTFKANHPKLLEIPFSSTTKFQLSIHALQNKSCLLVMKGAPENVLERCTKIIVNGETRELSEMRRKACNDACQQLAKMGERVLGFCDLDLEEKFTPTFKFSAEPPNFPQRGLRFLGFLALIDPPRPQVPGAVRKCREAGIKVFMVTGDHPVTAKAIAEDVGIISTSNALEADDVKLIRKPPTSDMFSIIIHGSVLKQLTSTELDDILYNYREIVFARTSPTQKLQIVEGCQRLGEIVAVTGDGVNDAPALKKADIGIAMGITGTEVSKQSADIILLDDNFASIVTGIEEGRRIFDNLKKSIVYTLSSNVPEIIPFLVYIMIDIPLPLGMIQILCIDLLTDMLPAISLAYEKSESDIMRRPPRNPKRDKLVTRKLYFLAFGHIGLFEALGGFFVYFLIMCEYGFFPEKLIGIRPQWENPDFNDLEDSYGQEWSYSQRKILEHTCHTAFMISVVVSQWADLIVCKTRLISIFKQGMGNMVLNVSIVVETAMACALSYTPGMSILNFYPVEILWWLYCIPFALFIFLFDEARKWHIRKYPRGYFQRETFY